MFGCRRRTGRGIDPAQNQVNAFHLRNIGIQTLDVRSEQNRVGCEAGVQQAIDKLDVID